MRHSKRVAGPCVNCCWPAILRMLPIHVASVGLDKAGCMPRDNGGLTNLLFLDHRHDTPAQLRGLLEELLKYFACRFNRGEDELKQQRE